MAPTENRVGGRLGARHVAPTTNRRRRAEKPRSTRRSGQTSPEPGVADWSEMEGPWLGSPSSPAPPAGMFGRRGEASPEAPTPQREVHAARPRDQDSAVTGSHREDYISRRAGCGNNRCNRPACRWSGGMGPGLPCRTNRQLLWAWQERLGRTCVESDLALPWIAPLAP